MLTKFINFYLSIRNSIITIGLGEVGRRIKIGRGVIFSGRRAIILKDGVTLENSIIIYGGSGIRQVEIGVNSTIGSFVEIRCHGGFISIGKNCLVNTGTVIFGAGGVEIGDDTMISPNCTLAASNHIFKRRSIPIREQGNIHKGIKIGKGCWIGANCTITDGVNIGEGVIIGAGSVVTKDIPSFSIAFGVPARVSLLRP